MHFSPFGRFAATVLALLLTGPVYGQVLDAFTDGDFSQNPPWRGDTADFVVDAQRLRSNGPAVTTTVRTLATPSRVSGAATWEFFANLKMATSSGNLADVFLVSDSLRLQGANHGYYVRLGGTPDEVSLFRKNGTAAATTLIDGADGLLASTTDNQVRVRVTRDATGEWTLEADPTGTGTAYQLQGFAVDTTYRRAAWTGVLVRYSATNAQKFFFDDFRITDTAPPVLRRAVATSATTLRVTFDEALGGPQTGATYTVSGGGAATQATLDPQDDGVVLLTFATPFGAGVRTLSVGYAEDRFGNGTPNALTTTFRFAPPPATPLAGEVRLSEFYVDTNPLVGLPARQFVEVLNTTAGKTFSLAGWKLRNASGASGTLSAGQLAPGQYAVLTRTADTAAYRTLLGPAVRIVGVSTFPTLRVAGEDVQLLSAATQPIDRVIYDDAWYQDAVKDDGGWSLELINPGPAACATPANWRASVDPSGGTPGRQNSIFSTLPDNAAPTVASVTIRTPTTLVLGFSEPVDTLSAGPSAFSFAPAVSVSATRFRVDSASFVTLTLAAPLVIGTPYALAITGLRDCAGNTTPLTVNVFRAPPGAVPLAGEVRLTEFYVDTNPVVGLPAKPFVEVLNTTTTKTFELAGWKIQDATGDDGTLAAARLAPGQYAVLVSAADTVLYRAALGPAVRLVGIASIPTLNVTGDEVRLSSDTGLLLDRVIYEDAWYQDAVKDDGGWSLELINPGPAACATPANWRASVDPSGGTPGRQNSIFSTLPDNAAPTVASVTIRTPTTLVLGFSEPVDTLSAGPSAFSFAPAVTVSATRFRVDSASFVTLTLAAPLVIGTPYALAITGLRDCAGNTTPLTVTVFRAPPGAVPLAGEVRLTEFYVDTNPVVGLPAKPFVEVFNTTTTKTFELAGWKIQDATGDDGTLAAARLAPGQYAVLVSAADTVLYRAALGPAVRLVGIASIPTLNVTGDEVRLSSDTGLLLDRVIYDDAWYQDAVKDDGGWSLELINPGPAACATPANWRASVDPSGGTPGRQNSIFSTVPDNAAPRLVNAGARNATTLVVEFTEVVDTLSVPPAAFALAPAVVVNRARFPLDSARFVVLTLAAPLAVGTRYTLTVTGARDCAGNTAVGPLTTQFGLGDAPGLYELLITEILADEAPQVELPLSEYLEIYNPTNRVLALGGCTLRKRGATGNAAVFAAGATLAPGQYGIVCGSTRGPLFAGYGAPVFPVANFPSLNSAGDTVVLRRPDGGLLFSVAYTDTWYQDETKAQGGWSLEMIDVTRPCGGPENWIASGDIRGGSPGAPNTTVAATLPDATPPALESATVLDSVTVVVRFSEKIDSLLASAPARYVLDGGPGAPLVTRVVVRGPAFREVVLALSAPLTLGQPRTLRITGLADCAGNQASQALSAQLLVPEKPRPGDVVINEILFNPRSRGVDFVELYNRSTRLLNLRNWLLASTRGDSLYQLRPVPGFVLQPGELVALTLAPDTLVKQYPRSVNRTRLLQLSSFPSYPDDAGTVVVLAPDSTELDRVTYSEKQHNALLTNDEGVSLERLSPAGPSNATNFASAAATVDYATPGTPNSQSRAVIAAPGDGIVIEPRVITPDEDGNNDFATISYAVPAAGYVANLTLYDAQGRLARRLVNNQSLALNGAFQWDGSLDDKSRAPVGYYVLFAEFFDLKGSVKTYKQTVAVGAR